MTVGVKFGDDKTEVTPSARHRQAIGELSNQRLAARFVTGVRWQFREPRRALAEVVHESREPHRGVRAQFFRLFDDHQRVQARVDLGVPFRRLRHAEQRVYLGQHDTQCITGTQGFEKMARIRPAERELGFLPDPVGYERIGFAAGDHLPHQVARFGRDTKTERREACCEACRAQDAHRVFDERVRNVAQQARFEVTHTAKRINQGAVGIDGKRIDGQVTAGQVFLDRNLRGRVECKTVVTGSRLALGASQRIFLFRFGVQENREVLADLLVAEVEQFSGRRADDAPVPFADRESQPFVPDSATYEVHLHRAILASGNRMIGTQANRFARVLIAIAALSLSGCYYLQAARGQLEVLNKREPIDEVIAAPGTPEDIARRLELVIEARAFAVEELLLPDNDSYLSYADIGRDYVVWNVFAAPEFSLEPVEWCFPITGCVSYRGYFKEQAARKKGAELQAEGYDVFVAGIPAYSTLGRFDDPVLNTMLHGNDADLVATIFHELAHQVLFVKDDSEFNESFATAVEQIGVERWLRERGEESELESYRERRALRQRLTDLVDEARADLETLYASTLAPHEMRQGKTRRLLQLLADLTDERARAGVSPPTWSAADINNAHLLTTRLYNGRVPEFLQLFRDCDEDFRCFYDRARQLAG